ncbi:MAG: RNA polymerase sigma factor [Planctomycetota bacterium]
MVTQSMESRAGKSSDDETIGRVLEGEANAFAGLISCYQDHVFGIVAKHVPFANVPEIAQDVFVEAFRSLANYAPKRPFDHWLARIAIRRCHDYWRVHYRQRETPVSQMAGDAREMLDSGSPIGMSAQSRKPDPRDDARELVDIILNRREPDDRMVLTMVHFEDRSIKETAQLLGWTRSKVKVRAHRARMRMREELKDFAAERGL